MKKVLLAMVAILAIVGSISAQAPQKNKEMGQVKQITQEEFSTLVGDYTKHQWKYLGSKPAIVDFYADWCGPCRAMSPILEQVAAEYKDKIVVYKVNIDYEKSVTAAFGVRSIPTLVFFPMTGEPQISVGAMNKEELKRLITKYLLK